jgi:hypothetical protein
VLVAARSVAVTAVAAPTPGDVAGTGQGCLLPLLAAVILFWPYFIWHGTEQGWKGSWNWTGASMIARGTWWAFLLACTIAVLGDKEGKSRP